MDFKKLEALMIEKGYSPYIPETEQIIKKYIEREISTIDFIKEMETRGLGGSSDHDRTTFARWIFDLLDSWGLLSSEGRRCIS